MKIIPSNARRMTVLTARPAHVPPRMTCHWCSVLRANRAFSNSAFRDADLPHLNQNPVKSPSTKTENNGLQPKSDGLHFTSDGLQPNSNGLSHALPRCGNSEIESIAVTGPSPHAWPFYPQCICALLSHIPKSEYGYRNRMLCSVSPKIP